jgi:ankyrin repeat protein
MRFWILSASLGLVLVAAAPNAQAQRFNSIGSGARPEQAPKVAPPPALPGAQSSSNAAPASKAPTDMEPNDALFDAINRGDLATARDAVSRGADLSATNVLGMTPLELSVDLGRNDISFMLMSMREGDRGGQGAPATKVSAAAQAKPTKQVQVKAKAVKVAKTAEPVPTQTPRLFAGDGGTPNPNAGFLGFDSGRR